MKKWLGLGILGLLFTFTSCEEKRTTEQVIGTDTTGVEYEVEKTVKEKEVDVDTVTKSETIEKDQKNQ